MPKTKRKKQKSFVLIEYIGWFGVTLLLLNYVLLASGILKGDGMIYHSGSLVGSLCIGLEAWSKKDRQPAVLNFVFVGVAVFAIFRIALTV